MNHAKVTLVALASALLFGCDGQQYVSPDTVELIITDTSTNMQRVNRCQYVPVLAGSRVLFRYEIKSGLNALLSITRDDVDVTFDPPEDSEPYHIDPEDLVAGGPPDKGTPPAGYAVELGAGCTPSDEYR